MKSIYLRNFLATALLVFVSFALSRRIVLLHRQELSYKLHEGKNERQRRRGRTDPRLLFQSRKRSGAGICV